MTSPLKRIESARSQAINWYWVWPIFSFSCSIWTKTHTKNKQSWKHKIRIIAKGGGRTSEILPKEGVCLCLVYLRQKPIFEILGLLFDISKTKANDTFNYWLDILRDILPASQMEEVRENREQYEKLRNLLTEYQLIVDSTEQPTARPVDWGAEEILLGQEKMHTKNQFIVLPLGQDIVDVPVGELGKRVTLICFETKFDALQTFLGDKAYKGELAITPDKKAKNSELTDLQIQANKKLSSLHRRRTLDW